MHWTRGVLITAVLALALVACGPSGPSEMELAQEAEWTWLQENKATLDEQRQQLAELREEVAMAAEATGEEGEAEGEVEGEAEQAPTQEDVETLENQLAADIEEFSGRLVAFLNDDPMIEGQPPSERQLAALHMKSEEDIALAQEWIDKGGDYKRAIDIYTTALRFDPDNQALKDALAVAEQDRFMSEERFAEAKKGMSESEVRAVLGQVNLRNVREFPEDKVIAWFYPTAEGGAAAGVYFREDKKGYRVYKLSYEALKPQSAEQG